MPPRAARRGRDIIPRLDARLFTPGEVVIHEGDVGDEMYFLTKGQVEVVRGDPPARLATLPPGAFFGELAILEDAPRAATIRALTDVEVYALRRDGVLQLAREVNGPRLRAGSSAPRPAPTRRAPPDRTRAAGCAARPPVPASGRRVWPARAAG